MELAAGSGLCFGEGIGRRDVLARDDETCAGQRVVDVLALLVDGGIDFVSDVVVALIALESDIVRRGDAPELPARLSDTAISRRVDDCVTWPREPVRRGQSRNLEDA